MIPGIDPKIDYAFKRIFAQERNSAVLIHLLNAVLQTRQLAPVTAIELLNPFNDKETSSDKLSVVDLKARDQLGRGFNVEMQLLSKWFFPDRVVYYGTRLHSRQLHEGVEYSELRPTLGICFLDDVQFPAVPEYHTCFRLREERHRDLVFSPHLEFHLLELPKFRLAEQDLHTPLEQWVYFLRHAAQLDTDRLPSALQVPEIRQAFQELIMVTQSDRDWARYEERRNAEMLARTMENEQIAVKQELHAAQQELLAIKQEQLAAQQEGLDKGDLIGRIALSQKLLRQTPTPREELVAMPAEELRRLAELLEQQVLAGFQPPTANP
jgi:predicted transposase/invertase (TIGR01784 family)